MFSKNIRNHKLLTKKRKKLTEFLVSSHDEQDQQLTFFEEDQLLMDLNNQELEIFQLKTNINDRNSILI